MKRIRLPLLSSSLLVAVLLACGASWLPAQGTFIWQGRLEVNGAPFTGNVGMTVTFHDAETDGNMIGDGTIFTVVPVNNGLFTLEIDPGDVYNGFDIWMQVQVSGPAGSATLSPRRKLVPTPYAHFAYSALRLGEAATALGQNVGINNAIPEITLVVNGEFRSGGNNTVSPNGGQSAVLGGDTNFVTGEDSVILGGRNNTINGDQAVTIGGFSHAATALRAVAIGSRAKVAHQDTIVINANSASDFGSSASNQILLNAPGRVGINLNNPTATLDVNGDIAARDGVRMGSDAGTSELPTVTVPSTGYNGMILRRLVTTQTTAGSVVARTGQLRLERDGTDGGFRIAWDANPGEDQYLTWTGVDSAGVRFGGRVNVGNPSSAGSTLFLPDVLSIVSFECQFGWVFEARDYTEVALIRQPGDSWWHGRVITTFNQ
jgi:hypothetical protein